MSESSGRAMMRQLRGYYKKLRPPGSIQEAYPQYSIGRSTYGIPKVRSWPDGPTLTIGAFCSIAAGVEIVLGGEHRTDWVTTYPFSSFLAEASDLKGHPRHRGDITIGNDVWIGTGAMIVSGVTVGDGAVIGARAVVTRSVPPYSIVAGVPAVVIRARFDNSTVQRLLAVKWWDWSDDRIKSHLPLLMSDDIEAFLEAAWGVDNESSR